VLEDDIIKFCKGRIANFKIPKSVVIVNNLPKLGSGKIAKRLLKEKYTIN
jgi:acyl-CoA synthetase (AMP-forming)/AMP-acid ligase II